MESNIDNAERPKRDRSPALTALENLRTRLLDLTARNRLINFRHTKGGSLRIIDELPNQLVETLLAETEMRFVAVREPTEEELVVAGYLEFEEETGDLRRLRKDPTAEEWAKYLGFATGYEVPEPSAEADAGKHSDRAIQTLLYPYEMEARLKSLLQTSESAIQEMGANILYLAFGFLEWYDTNSSDSARIAPLFLVPVRLHKGRLNPRTRTYEYTLSYSGEDIIPNLSLREKLKTDCGMALPDLDENTVPEAYIQQVRELIEETQPRWRVRRYISLALLNFSKLLMYLDLDPERWPDDGSIIDHSVVRRFLEGYEQVAEAEEDSAGAPGFGEEYLIDEVDEVHGNYPLIDDADSSQHSALIDAVDGKNLVIEGPPGTGKSQTITNLIAAAVAQGKRVLFVAEKLAALEVVRSRLDAVGLGEFCLELHSHKSRKRKVLDEVDERLKKNGRYRRPEDIEFDIARYEELKTALNGHAEKINQPWKATGRTLHEIFAAATRYRTAVGINPETVHPEGYDGSNYERAIQRRNGDQVEAFRKVYQAVAAQLEGSSVLQEHPWCGVQNSDLQFFDLDRVKQSLGAWNAALQRLDSEREKVAETIGCELSDVAGTAMDLSDFAGELESIPALHGNEILERLPILRGGVLENAQRSLKLFLEIQELYGSLAAEVGPEILQDLAVVERLIQGSEQLKQLVGRDVELGRLAEAINRLTAIQDQLAQLDEPLHGVAAALGEPGSRYLVVSESGLSEFKTVIELVSQLNPSYWKHRDALFDNEEMDGLLPQLRKEIEELRGLHRSVDGSFALDALPPESEIRQLQGTLAAGGWFKWFKLEWWTARRQALGYAANPQIALATLEPLLGEFAEYSDRREKFTGNSRYRAVFGDRLKGIDTDVDALEALRGWYRRVRHQYGVGFGQKVLLGDAVLEIPRNFAKAVRSLSERGMHTRINDLLDDLGSLKQVFEPVAELRSSDTLLVGEKGVIPRLLGEVNAAVRACGPLAEDGSLSMEGLAERIERIGHLKHRVEKWREADFDQKLFQGRLGLKPGVDADNDEGLSALRNTLNLAACVDGELGNRKLVGYIYRNPNSAAFESLALHRQQLRAALAAQESSYDAFKELVRLDWGGWTTESGEQLEELISRNQRACRRRRFSGCH